MAEGQLTIGSYELRNCIATGNTTQIWEVAEAGTPMQLAMKLLLKEAHKNPAEKSILKHEFKVGSLLDHPSFLRFHHLEVNRDHGFFIMDFVRSPSLKTQLTSNLAGLQGSFRKLAEALSGAFHFMHEKGWLHRDIKPDNILVNKAGEAKIIDFSLTIRLKSGLGKMFGGRQKAIQGTRTYIAPETILKKSIDQRTDLYSLGVTLYEIVAGQPPFAGLSPNELLKKHVSETPAPPSAMNPNVTPDLDKVLLKMLAKAPKDRFENMQEAASAFRGLNCFKEDPVELHERKVREAKEHETMSVDKRLDSRADAERSALGLPAPARPKRQRVVSPELLRAEEERLKKEAAKSGAAEQPVPGMMPMMPPMAYPGMPQYGMPGYGMPHYGMPGYGMPGQPMPGQPLPHQQQPAPQPAPQPPPQIQQQPPQQPQPAPTPAVPPAPAAVVPDEDELMPIPAPLIIESEAPHPSAAAASDAADATEDDLKDLMDMIE